MLGKWQFIAYKGVIGVVVGRLGHQDGIDTLSSCNGVSSAAMGGRDRNINASPYT